LSIPLDDGSVTLVMIHALFPLGLRAVEEALPYADTALAGARNARRAGRRALGPARGLDLSG